MILLNIVSATMGHICEIAFCLMSEPYLDQPLNVLLVHGKHVNQYIFNSLSQSCNYVSTMFE